VGTTTERQGTYNLILKPVLLEMQPTRLSGKRSPSPPVRQPQGSRPSELASSPRWVLKKNSMDTEISSPQFHDLTAPISKLAKRIRRVDANRNV